MHIDLIVFDMTGTTVLGGEVVGHVLTQALAAAGVRASRDQINAVVGMAKPAAIELLLTEFRGQAAASRLAVDAVHADFSRRMLWHYESHPDVHERDGAAELFAWCHRHGIRTALDTGFSRVIAEAILKRLRWIEHGLVDAMICADDGVRTRPHPDMIRRAMTDTGVTDPARVMKVGDTPMDILQGRAAGCSHVVGITSGAHSAAALRAHAPTHLIAELLELPDLLTASARGAA